MNTLKKDLQKEALKQFKEGKIKDAGGVETFLDDFIGPILQALLEAEMDCHLNYNKHEKKNENSKLNQRNGYCKEKKVKTKYGETMVKTPRDRNGSYAPQIVPKKSNVFNGIEEACVSLYAKGMSTRDIETIINQLYSVKITKDQVSVYVSKIQEEVKKWRERKLKPIYAFVYADCIYYSIKDELLTQKHAVYVMIGVTVTGQKEVLGFWRDETESATFWNKIFRELKTRGVEDILYLCSDGVAGLSSALESVFPLTTHQRCIVHLVRNLYTITPKKIAKNVIADYKLIYSSTTLDEASENLNKFIEKYNDHNNIVDKVIEHFEYMKPLFELPIEIRKAIYTTNLIESVNSTLRRVTNNKGAFNSEISLFSILYLRVRDLSQKWTKPIPNSKKISIQLSILFEDRISKHYDIEKLLSN